MGRLGGMGRQQGLALAVALAIALLCVPVLGGRRGGRVLCM